MKIEIKDVTRKEKTFNYESILFFNLEEIIADYDKKIFSSLQKNEYTTCENHLSDFCFAILDMSEEEQMFVARTFFVSIITDIIRIQNRKKHLHPRMLSNAYAVIAKVEKWDNLSEYLLSISWFVEQIKDNIVSGYLLVEGCLHIKKAFQLISENLTENILSVAWLADQLGISTTHLSNLFKLQVGETVSSFITRRKMNEIIFELTYTNKPLKKIREKYGYFNHSYFIQHFKKHQGTTPLKFKQELHFRTE